MNYVKIEQEILKTNIKAMTNKTPFCRWRYGCMDNQIGVIDQGGHIIILIPADDFYLDLKVFGNTDPFNIRKMFNADGLMPLTNTGTMITAANGKTTLKEFKFSDNSTVYVDYKLFKYFDSCNGFKGIGPAAPVFCYEDDTLRGLILPFKIK